MSATISNLSRLRYHATLAALALEDELAMSHGPAGTWSVSAVAAMANETLPHRRYVHERRRTPADARREAERAMRWRD